MDSGLSALRTPPRNDGACDANLGIAVYPESYGVSYTRSALIKLLARMDVEYRKPEVIPRKLDPARQQAFIEAYDNLLNNLGDDEAVLFADAVHPTHEVRPAGCWAPKDVKVALEQTS